MRVKYPFMVVVGLVIISFIPILNTVTAYKMLCKILL